MDEKTMDCMKKEVDVDKGKATLSSTSFRRNREKTIKIS